MAEAALPDNPPAVSSPRAFSGTLCTACAAMRVHQWVKNVLVLVPALAAHRLLDPVVFGRVCLGFLSFSLCASAGYLLNDLLDLEADRSHPVKRNRPFASGSLSPRFGLLLAIVLAISAAGSGLLISPRFSLLICVYLVLTVGYSAFLKTLLLVDVFLLSLFYTLRIFLGSEAAGVPVSFWLAAFSTFFFFSLATGKRYAEVATMLNGTGAAGLRRSYLAEDLPMLSAWGVASGCASVVVLALYINNPDVTRLYRHPAFLWPIGMALLFWLNRLWMLANRKALPYDPIVFALRDPVSYAVVAASGIAFALAI